jgi:hypothetical protein
MELEVQDCPSVRTKLHAADDISEQIVINLQNDSDNSSCSSSEEEEE